MVDAPPALFQVHTDLDGVHIRLPRRISGRARDHRRLQLAVVGAALGAAGLALAAAPVVQAGGDIALVAVGVFLAGLLPYGLLFAGQQRLIVSRQVSLSDAVLHVEGRTVPLEEIASASVARAQQRGRLLLDTEQGTIAVLDGLLVGELAWLAALIEAHAARRRAAVGEGRAQVPAALTSLVAKASGPPAG